MLGDEEGEAEQMVAVLDARQATTLQVTRKVNLIKRLALELSQVHTLALRIDVTSHHHHHQHHLVQPAPQSKLLQPMLGVRRKLKL